MSSVQDIKRRVRSVSKPYADRMQELMIGTARASTSLRGLPLLQRREVRRVAIVPLTGDRGLAGPFNAQILRRAFASEREYRRQGVEVRWLVAGKKGLSTLRFRRYQVDGSWTGFADQPGYGDAQAIAHRVAQLYIDDEVDRVVIVYNQFESALLQRVVEQELLPVPEEALQGEDQKEDAIRGDFIYEPEPEQILERLLPAYVETQIYRALLESAASYQGAQMTAMRNASQNAGELIDSLTLAMNRARQAEITQEILEVVAGADALS